MPKNPTSPPPEAHAPTEGRQMTDSQDQVTLGEVIRRLDHFGAQMDGLATELRQDRAMMASTYVPRETYGANREADDMRFKVIETWQAGQDGFRRQVLAGLVLLFFSSLAGIVLAVTGLK